MALEARRNLPHEQRLWGQRSFMWHRGALVEGRDTIDGGGPVGEEARSEAVAGLLEQWHRFYVSAKESSGEAWPTREALLVAEAVASAREAEVDAGLPDSLHAAGVAWGRAHSRPSGMVAGLSALREALVMVGGSGSLSEQRAVDVVTAAATEELLNRLEEASRTDALTGTGNRRALDETLQSSLAAAARQGHHVAVVLVDLDGLKNINDTMGHAAGDEALVSLTRAFATVLRDGDSVYRIGGDEFVLVLPFTSALDVPALMARAAAAGAPAFSWGAAESFVHGTTGAELLAVADADLYGRRHVRRAERRDLPRPAHLAGPDAELQEMTVASRLRAWLPGRGLVEMAAAVAVLVLALVMVALLVPGGPPGHLANANRHPGTHLATARPVPSRVRVSTPSRSATPEGAKGGAGRTSAPAAGTTNPGGTGDSSGITAPSFGITTGSSSGQETTQPTSTEPPSTQPTSTEPATTQPTSTQPPSTQPTSTQPATSKGPPPATTSTTVPTSPTSGALGGLLGGLLSSTGILNITGGSGTGTGSGTSGVMPPTSGVLAKAQPATAKTPTTPAMPDVLPRAAAPALP